MKMNIQKEETKICPCDLAKYCSKRTDEEIIEFVKANKECYALLVERYETKLARYVKRISGVTTESVEDILQTVFIKAYVNLNGFDTKNRFSPWIYRIAHNETVNHWRKNAKANSFVSLDENEFLKNIIPDQHDLGKEVAQRIDGRHVSQALKNLNGGQKEALTLRYVEEFSYEEIAEKLEKPVGTVGTLINRGKKMLREELVRTGFSQGMI